MSLVLQDPSVASAPLEQRIAFLKSKNLTQEEIDVSLQRVGSESVAPSSPSQGTQGYNYPPQQYRQGGGGYGNYPNGYWQPPPPPEAPRRDWRDWFIMATVVGGVGYGAYVLAKRYIYPVIAPPTPPQLEQDKASIDASFDKAFALLEQLSTDTEELKASEKSRTERLDVALTEVESVITYMKDATRRRDEEVRRTNDEVRSLRDLIPKAIKAQEESADTRLKELAKEMQSLKTLIANRVNPGRAPQPQQPQVSTSFENPTTPAMNGSATASAFPAPPTAGITNGASVEQNGDHSLSASQTPARSAAASPYSARLNGRAKIPAWQMAAQKANEESAQDTSESGTAVDATTT
ncbi:peroxisomal membrane anchor protein conserved region-domain-containing protein [Elsinoe ampelina]|uniref:Peroxisomal membrane protein PEX14 n=1 Tax=Elsinoe ampelina TaxID=302913 RepID=A0A6A6GLM4_9PEZI|nr:peroxisomal membrane anchor protein conserved region-domain-containing protein [Elsinoe ampelina]